MIDKYVKENVQFICELPLLIGIEDEKDPVKVENPYKQVPICPIANLNIEQIVEDIVECCAKVKYLTKESHELCRKKATRILTFLLSSSDREKSNTGVEHIPIAYALKGPSLKVSVMRQLIEEV